MATLQPTLRPTSYLQCPALAAIIQSYVIAEAINGGCSQAINQ